MAIDLSIIIVTYNHEAEIYTCLFTMKNILESFRIEIIIIDNASSDDTVSRARMLLQEFDERHTWSILTNTNNEGFTRGINQGLDQSQGKYILLLNPDTEFPMPIFQELISILESDEKIGIVSPQFRNPDGSIQPSCRRFPRHRDVFYAALGWTWLFPTSKEFNCWKMGEFDHKTRQEIEQPQGAFLLTRRTALDQVGKLDESFPMFFSDVDWCRRFIHKGWKIVFTPEFYIIHYKGTSIYRNRLKMLWSSHRSFIDYFKKYYVSPKWRFANIVTETMLYILAVMRSIIFLARGIYRKSPAEVS